LPIFIPAGKKRTKKKRKKRITTGPAKIYWPIDSLLIIVTLLNIAGQLIKEKWKMRK